jgi:hypothetical protein
VYGAACEGLIEAEPAGAVTEDVPDGEEPNDRGGLKGIPAALQYEL